MGRRKSPRKCRVKCIRSTGLMRIRSPSCCSDASGPVSASRTGSGISTATKTRQRSTSSAGMTSNLDLDPAGTAEGRLTVIDRLRKPRGRAQRAENVDRGRQDKDDGEVELVGAALEHRGDHVTAIRWNDAGHTPDLERLNGRGKRR